MEVDNDVEAQLLQQFSSMGTTDKEVLVMEFQKLVGNEPNPSLCAFFLDMNNWNLPAAIGSYYDYEQPMNAKTPVMSFVKDITIGEGESVPPDTPFIKTWRIQNTGQEMWPPGCCLCFMQGDRMGDNERVIVDALQPGAVTDVSVQMRSPSGTGIYQGQWRMQTATGLFFGEMIWVILQVEENGLLGVTQQFSNISSGSLSNNQSVPQNLENPFSPRKLAAMHAQSTTAAERPANFEPSAMGDNPFLSSATPSFVTPPQFGSADGSKCPNLRHEANHSGNQCAPNGVSRTLMSDDSNHVTHTAAAAGRCGSDATADCHDLLLNILNIPSHTAVHSSAHATAHGLPNSWPGTPTLSMTHDISAPTPNVSPNSNAATTDSVEDMT